MPSNIDSDFVDKLEDNPEFRDWLTYGRARKDVGEFYDRRAIESQKIASEFSKIIVTNLHFINAAGLGAVPTLSSSLLGISGLDRYGRFYYLGIPMSVFALGLIFASLCAFQTYRNFSAAAQFSEYQRLREIANIEAVAHIFSLEYRDIAKSTANKCEILASQAAKKINKTQNYALGCGWISIACFIGACSFLAYNIH